ncbi:PhoD-like phosphatase [Calothrix sp. FACHB-1219]|uniref:PhoD-like phosphatase n=1 Tax=unclassified Calothrix TaxID=2619626 RepID=UPI001685CCCB|nr:MULTISPECIES: PhoD-like phosphatase [unclassified Calothrix]MBD2204728.1 PhoD-like phosphatase [Calothrix sp. FACHB-168]MBD2218124.1 PhoD-like phosphatase [Calothrix sp. FACHB-1219]
MKHPFSDEFLQELPLILAGPILQHTESDAVTVWIALKRPCEVVLQVYDTANRGELITNLLFEGRRRTFALGKFLHIVAVTAESAGSHLLSSDRIYAYDLQFIESSTQQQTLATALCSRRFPTVNISYFDHQKPTFALPPTDLQDLRIVHGSCRKPHGDGFDALPILDCLIESAANQPNKRPHQLFLTGDQIYGDDVADPLLWVSSQLGDALLGWEERLPVTQYTAADPSYYTPKQLLPGHRADIATNQAGFTAGLHNKTAKVSSHLLSLGEYYASYILSWSPACWPSSIPQGHEVMHGHRVSRRWDKEVRDMQQFTHTLWKVRRALANVPMYSIFDDHDVSDDWNLNQAWCLRVLGQPLGRRTVQNALLAYAVFQAWGNTPQQFAAGQPGEKLLQAAADWSASGGMNGVAENAIARYLGMPPLNPSTNLPEFVQYDAVLVLDRDPEALTWHYTIRSFCHEVIVLDTRTWRGYPADQKPIAPPMLLSPPAFTQQLSQPLEQVNHKPKGRSQLQATFVIAPTNLFGLEVIDWIHHWHLKRDKVYGVDVGDAWNINYEALAQFLTTLFEQRRQVIVLSGDIHYSSVVRLTYTRKSLGSEKKSVLVQLTASAFKNEEKITEIIHTRLKQWLLPEKNRQWIGWKNPPYMLEISSKKSYRESLSHRPPEWHGLMEWVHRKFTKTAEFGHNISWLMTAEQHARNLKWELFQYLTFWKLPWFQDGREVIGLNNLALVHFEIDNNNSSKVIQDLYWFSTWYPIEIVYSRFESELTHSRLSI